MRLPIAVLLVSACTPAKPDWTFQGTAQDCQLRAESSPITTTDVLFVVDDSWAMEPLQQRIGSELERVVDATLTSGDVAADWLHIGVISADPADLARLRGGCGIAADRPYVDFLRGAISNLEPASTVGKVVGCLAQRGGTAGAANQQPMAMAARLLSTDIAENRGFRRPDAVLAVIFLVGADYTEDGQPLLDAQTPDPYDTVFESVAPPSSHLDPVVAAAKVHVQLPFDAADWSPLFQWGRIFEPSFPSCITVPPRDPASLDFVVEDVTYNANGTTSIAELAPCTATDWQPTCWYLANDTRCDPTGLRFAVQRPIEGPPRNTVTRVSWDCALE